MVTKVKHCFANVINFQLYGFLTPVFLCLLENGGLVSSVVVLIVDKFLTGKSLFVIF